MNAWPARKALCILVAAATTGAMALAQGQQTAKPPQTTKPNSDVWVMGSDPSAQKTAPPAQVVPKAKRLPDPSPERIQQIIHAFTANEKLFRTLLSDYYVYTESILAQALDADGNPEGQYQQVNQIQYTPTGEKQIVCSFCPQPTIDQYITITSEDITDMFNMNMYTISLDDLPQYNITYVDHEPLDQITAYVFSIAPKQIVKGHRYFQGKVWVDDQSVMIVKSEGRVVPNEYDKHGNPTNTFLPFTVWRQRIDGKYWFPVYTLMQGSIPGGDGAPAVPMKMVLQFTNYKRFRAITRILSVTALPPENPPNPNDKKNPPVIPHR